VYCTYATVDGHALVGARIWVPAEQLDDPARREELGIGQDVVFTTKPQLAKASSRTWQQTTRCPRGSPGTSLWPVAGTAGLPGELDPDYIREKTLEGQQAAAARGNHGGRPKVIDEDDVLLARALRDKGTPMPDIVKKLTIKTGKNASHHPSVAALYRALADNDARPGTTRPLGRFLPYPGGPRERRDDAHGRVEAGEEQRPKISARRTRRG
jgi:hypothetical protein